MTDRAEIERAGSRLRSAGLTLERNRGGGVWDVRCDDCGRTIDVVLSVYVAQPKIGCWCGKGAE